MQYVISGSLFIQMWFEYICDLALVTLWSLYLSGQVDSEQVISYAIYSFIQQIFEWLLNAFPNS